MTSREIRDILPENNTGLSLVPQILTNKTTDFLSIAAQIASYGYDTVNLNLGCPSGTVTAKKRGAGFLSDPETLDAFLYEIYEKCPLKISIKTRLGVSDLREWERLLDIYRKYPVQELIIHTRLLREFYAGPTHPEAFADAMDRLCAVGIPLCYNGDIVSEESLRNISDKIEKAGMLLDASRRNRVTGNTHHRIDRVMIGRGLLSNPALAGQLRLSEEKAADTFRSFHDEILDGYRQIMSGDLPVLFKMKDLWTYMIAGFCLNPNDASKHLKKIRKADRLSEYKIAVDGLLREKITDI